MRSIPVNWTKLLGQVMAVCNSHSGIRKNSLSSYKAVFGQKYHPQLKCNISDMRECESIFQRLKLSPNEHLETYVWQHNIVDIELDETEFEDNNSDKAYDSENEGDDLNDNAFPELNLNPDNFQIGNIYKEITPLQYYGLGTLGRGQWAVAGMFAHGAHAYSRC